MAAIDRDHLPGDPRGLLGDEEEDAVRDVLGLAETPRGDVAEHRALPRLAVALPLADARRVREGDPGRDAVHRYPERAELVRGLPREANLARLRARIGLDSGEADAPARA